MFGHVERLSELDTSLVSEGAPLETFACRDCTGIPNLFAERILEANLLSERKHLYIKRNNLEANLQDF
jgi:hypothetical protein